MKITLGAALAVLLFASVAHADTSTRSDIITYTNIDRLIAGLSMVRQDPALMQAAQEKAEDMALRGYFSHTSPDGRSPWAWLQADGYSYIRAAENLALNSGSALSIEQAWMQSPPHRANILDGAFTRVGVGVAKGWYQGRSMTYVVQYFAAPVLWAEAYHSQS